MGTSSGNKSNQNRFRAGMIDDQFRLFKAKS